MARAQLALAAGEPASGRDAAETFGRMAGFADQAAWLPALSVQADAALQLGDTAMALNAYSDIRRILTITGDAGTRIRDSIAALAGSLRN